MPKDLRIVATQWKVANVLFCFYLNTSARNWQFDYAMSDTCLHELELPKGLASKSS